MQQAAHRQQSSFSQGIGIGSGIVIGCLLVPLLFFASCTACFMTI